MTSDSMTRFALPLGLCVFATLLGTGPAVGAQPPKLSLDVLESRAKAAGWKLLSREGEEGGEWSTLELDDGKHYAYVSTLDLSASRDAEEDSAFEQAKAVGLQVVVEEPGAANQKAKDLLASIVARQPLDSLTRDGLKATLTALGWRIQRADLDQQDGVAQSMIDASHASGAVARLDLVDSRAAAKEERAYSRGAQYVVVAVCKDCQARKSGFLASLIEREKAQKLLRRLTK